MKVAFMGILYDRDGWLGPSCTCTKCLCQYTPNAGTTDIVTVEDSPEGLQVLTRCPICHTYIRTATGIKRPEKNHE